PLLTVAARNRIELAGQQALALNREEPTIPTPTTPRSPSLHRCPTYRRKLRPRRSTCRYLGSRLRLLLARTASREGPTTRARISDAVQKASHNCGSTCPKRSPCEPFPWRFGGAARASRPGA